MLKLLGSSGGNLVCFEATGTLTEDDYCDVFEVAMIAVLESHATFRMYADLSALIDMDESSRWDSGAILAGNRDKCEKIALVGGPSWAGLALMLRDSLPDGAHEFFADGRQADALRWVQA